MHPCILSPWGNGIPLNKLFIVGEDFSFPKRKARATACSIHCCKVVLLGNVLGKLTHDFSTFFNLFSRKNFQISLVKFVQRDRFQ